MNNNLTTRVDGMHHDGFWLGLAWLVQHISLFLVGMHYVHQKMYRILPTNRPQIGRSKTTKYECVTNHHVGWVYQGKRMLVGGAERKDLRNDTN